MIKDVSQKDSLGFSLKGYTAVDNLFWAEQVAEVMANIGQNRPFKDKLDSCLSKEIPSANLPYATDIQRLYLLLLLEQHDLFSESFKQAITEGVLPYEMDALFSITLFPQVADSLSHASKESQKRLFFSACMLYLETHADWADAADVYIFFSVFYEFCGTIQLSHADWEELVSAFPTMLSGKLMKRTIEDFSTLLHKNRSNISADILSQMLLHLGNINAAESDLLASTISNIFFELFPDEKSLIKMLLNDNELCKIKKAYSVPGRIGNNKPENIEECTEYSQRKSYPYCLAESTISKICDAIVSKWGVLDAHELFCENGWYSQNLADNIPFFVEIRRKSLNLSLTNYARMSGEMGDLENLIYKCLTPFGKKHKVQKAYKEEALYLCRNSVPTDEKSPMAFTDNIYNILVFFVKDPSMEEFIQKRDVRRFYAKHNLFALFDKCTILVTLKGETRKVEYRVTGYSR